MRTVHVRRSVNHTKHAPLRSPAQRAVITCAECGHGGRDAWLCCRHGSQRAAELIHALLDAGGDIPARLAAIGAMRRWARLEEIAELEGRETRRLLRGAVRFRSRTALRTVWYRLTANDMRAPEPISEIARRARVDVSVLKAMRDRFIRRTSFAAGGAL
jgi:hypothetical protein